MKRTKIICTMGPNTNDKKLMKDMAIAGMDVARFNFSHGDYEEHLGRLNILREVREETGKHVAALLDTKGPEIRTGLLEGGQKVTLVAGNEYTLTINECVGNDKKGFINYSGLNDDVKAGDRILIDDGLIELEVISVEGADIHTKILNGGELGEKKGVNVPGVSIKLPALTQKDIEDVKFACDNGFDFIAASFIRNGDAVRQIREILKEKGSTIQIISKIENQEGIDNMDDIIEASDGIMVARGDMGVEIPYERLPAIQKDLITKCRLLGRRVITATEMLESMINNPRPTRAEASDVANAVYDGTSAIMLSGETAAGHYPIQAVEAMSKIAENTEQNINYRKRFYGGDFIIKNEPDAISHATCGMAIDIEAKAIVACTISGMTARLVSRFRGPVDIIGLTTDEKTWRKLALSWGVIPKMCERFESTDVLFYSAKKVAEETLQLCKGDKLVITGGIANGVSGSTNLIKVENI